MGVALLNIVSNSGVNKILTGNPEKTFFKKIFSRFTNFGIQRLELNYGDIGYLKLTERQQFTFPINYLGDLLLDTYFSITLPNIYSPLFQIPRIKIDHGDADTQIVDFPYYHQFEFKWIENLGAQIIEKVEFEFDGRVVQEYSGDYILNKSYRDLNENKLNLFRLMIGDIKEITDPANAYNRNGNYPNASFNGVTSEDVQRHGGISPSIVSRQIMVPINIWGILNPDKALPTIGLQYSRMQIKVTCRPLCDLFVVRNIDYYFDFFSKWITGDNINDYKFYNPPYTRINPNDLRTKIFYFLQPPPSNRNAIGSSDTFEENSNNSTVLSSTDNENINNIISISKEDWDKFLSNPQTSSKFYELLGEILLRYQSTFYTNLNGSWNLKPKIITTNVFLENDERRYLAGNPQRYLVTQIREQKVSNIAGDFKIQRSNANGMMKNIMFYFKRSDVYLRNEWSNYSNFEYNNRLPFPNILYVNLYENINNLNYIDTNNEKNRININSLLEYTITGPVRPENQENILLNFTILLNNYKREDYFESGIYNYTEKYARITGSGKNNLYHYSFELDSSIRKTDPTGGINTSKYSNIEWQFSTINPYSSRNILDKNLNIISNCLIEPVCVDSNEIYKDTQGVCPPEIPEHFKIIGANRVYWYNFEYNYDFYLSEERYNILDISGGFVRMLF